MSSLILVVLIGTAVLWGFSRLRGGGKKIKLPFKGKTAWSIVIVAAIVVLLFYGASHGAPAHK
jgi:hypothetical protein